MAIDLDTVLGVTTIVEPNEEDTLRILLAHVVDVVDKQAPGQLEECQICMNAVKASKVPPTKGHRPKAPSVWGRSDMRTG